MAESLSLPPIGAFHTLPRPEQLHALDLLFEPSPALHDLVADSLSTKTFSSYDELISHVEHQAIKLFASEAPGSRQTLQAIVGSHPRLGAKKVESAQSAAEQEKLQSSEQERLKLESLNETYEAKFPGLRFVTFVNGRDREDIMSEMRMRIDMGDPDREIAEAIRAMRDIAMDRASKLPIRSE